MFNTVKPHLSEMSYVTEIFKQVRKWNEKYLLHSEKKSGNRVEQYSNVSIHTAKRRANPRKSK
jgi:hypothetical protein